jgi:MFS family permease
MAAVVSPPVAEAPPAPLDFEIVPRRALPIVGVVLVALVVAIAANEFWPVEFLHVVFGSAWTIIDLFLGFVLGPIIGGLPVGARVAFLTRFMPKMVVIMPTVVTVTLAAGWQLGNLLGTVQSSYANHSWVVASYIVVGVMSVIALGLLEPANIAVLVELKKRRPDPQVVERLMKRFMYSAGILGTLQIATFVIMTKLRTG